jgi:histidine triad (HIT) family protein
MADCVFCNIIQNRTPETTILHESSDAVIIPDIRPSAPVHYLVVTKRHITSIADTEESDTQLLGNIIAMGREGAKKLGLSGYKLVFNVGHDGGQIIGHVHLHILGGWAHNEPKAVNV